MDQKVMFQFGYGLYVLTANADGVDNGCIINTAIQVTSTPCRVLIAVNKQNRTHDMIMASRKFNISMIAEDASFSLFQHFGFQSGKKVNKFADYPDCARAQNGVMYITKGTNAYVSARVCEVMDMGTHTIFVAEVMDGAMLSDVPTVTYSYYQSHIKPKPEAPKKTDSVTWVCKVCGYVYEGDPLPADFVCPICKHGAADFERRA
ncbi:MAG: flavin reductase [Clostridium sp.]|nr:flavin reductase [Clostridium sp.]